MSFLVYDQDELDGASGCHKKRGMDGEERRVSSKGNEQIKKT